MILLTVLTGCSTALPTVEVPQISTDIERPVLVAVPELHENFTEKQLENIAEVVNAYTYNLAVLVNYSTALEEQTELVVKYYLSVIDSLNRGSK